MLIALLLVFLFECEQIYKSTKFSGVKSSYGYIVAEPLIVIRVFVTYLITDKRLTARTNESSIFLCKWKSRFGLEAGHGNEILLTIAACTLKCFIVIIIAFDHYLYTTDIVF